MKIKLSKIDHALESPGELKSELKLYMKGDYRIITKVYNAIKKALGE